VVVDEAFMDFQEDGTLNRRFCAAGNLIVLRSMTKCMPWPGCAWDFGGFSTARQRVREADEPWSVSAWRRSPDVRV
jgi:histidinol-phosphate/aromatic aminotransferase/cobyric acid decarboxylase-like protein